MAVIDSLKLNNGTILYPKTLTSAIYNVDGTERLDNILAKSIYADDEIPSTPLPRDADTLGGVLASGYALKDAGIVESGNNANGYYVKYGNGMMICRYVVWRNANGSGNIDTSLSFPTLYLYAPTVIAQLQDTGHQSWTGNLQLGDIATNSVRIVVTGATSGLGYYIMYVSIGQWK